MRSSLLAVPSWAALAAAAGACAPALLPPPPPSPPPLVDDEEEPPPRLVADPPPGTFSAPLEVELSIADAGALGALVIWYTLDGSVPVEGGSLEYAAPIVVERSTALRALAVDASGAAQLEMFGAFLMLEPDAAAFSSSLPLLVLWSSEPRPEQLSAEHTPFTLSAFEPVDEGARVVWPAPARTSTRAGLRVRGSSTAGYPKRPYRVETWGALADDDDDIELLGMPKEADWILLPPLDFDRALMRNSLTFAMSSAAGRWAPRTRFAEVFVVGDGGDVGMDDYVGVYEVTERIERGSTRVDIARLDPNATGGSAVTGGYLFKEDRLGPEEQGFSPPTAGDALTWQQPFVWVDPDERDVLDAQRGYLSEYLADVAAAVTAPDFTSPATARHYTTLIDVGAFIDHHALNVLAKNPDAFRLSGFYFKDRDGPLAAGPLWDFDRTMGCSSDPRCDDPTWWDASVDTDDTTFVFEHGFYRGLFADPAFRARYFARFAELIDGPLAAAQTDALIDAMATALAEAAPRNFARWSDYPPRGSFADEVALLKGWLQARREWIRGCLALPDPRECTGD